MKVMAGIVVGIVLATTNMATAEVVDTGTLGVWITANVVDGKVEASSLRTWITENQRDEDDSPPPPPPLAEFPDASNTGVPTGTELSTYAGPCTITVPNAVIDAKTVNCDLIIRAAGVKITRSKINGYITSGTIKTTGYSFSVTDSEIDASPNGARQVTAVGEVNFTVLRSHIHGGNRSANCWFTCSISDSYFHGQDTDNSGTWHESGIRMGENATIVHNAIACDAPDVPPDAGCSADLTGYGDFGPVQNNRIEHNLFKETTGGFCAYGGSSKGKPYSAQATNIVFRDNVFERGTHRSDHGTFICGYYGAIADFDPSRPGNVWVGNTFDDGTALNP
jgi:hypothetical protein